MTWVPSAGDCSTEVYVINVFMIGLYNNNSVVLFEFLPVNLPLKRILDAFIAWVFLGVNPFECDLIAEAAKAVSSQILDCFSLRIYK